MGRWLTPLLLFLAILLGLAVLLQQSASRGSFADAGSTYRAAEDGSRALYLLAEAAGLPVDRRHLDLNLVDHEGTLVLIGISGGSSCLSPEEKDAARSAEEEEDSDSDDSDSDEADESDSESSDESDGESKEDAEEDDTPEEVVVGPTPGFGLFGPQLASEECAALLEWVSEGGHLVHVTDENDALLRRLEITVRVPPTETSATEASEAPDEPTGTVEAPVDQGEGEEIPPWEKWLEDSEEEKQKQEAEKKRPPPRIAFLPRKLDAEGPVHRFVPGQPSVFTRGVQTVASTGEARIESKRGDSIAVLVEAEAPETGFARPVAALAVPHGEGWVLTISVPELALNRTLGNSENASFWLTALGELTTQGTLAFDEYHHGHAAGRTILGYALEHGLLPALLQVVLLLVVAVLAGRRLGLLERLPGETMRSTADHLATMANLYRLGGHRRHAATAIGKRALAQSARFRTRPEVEAAAAALEALLSRVELSKPTERELIEVANAAAQLYEAVHQKQSRKKQRKRGKHAA